MDEEKRKEFEYKQVIVDEKNKYFILDVYQSFGWEEDETIVRYDNTHSYSKKMLLRLKRGPKITNRMELIRLERKFEACVKDVEKMECSKTLMANAYAIGLGIIGTGFLIGAWKLWNEQPVKMVLAVVFVAIGVVSWVFPIFVYKVTVKKESEKLNPYIEEKYEEIFEACKKGKRLLHKE